jgi:hypothetical protein
MCFYGETMNIQSGMIYLHLLIATLAGDINFS